MRQIEDSAIHINQVEEGKTTELSEKRKADELDETKQEQHAVQTEILY